MEERCGESRHGPYFPTEGGPPQGALRGFLDGRHHGLVNDLSYRVCVEFLPPQELALPSVVRLLERFGVAPLLALPPHRDDLAGLLALAPFTRAGLGAGIWPLLDDRDGYWPSEGNAARFAERTLGLLDLAARHRLTVPWIAVDLEPRLDELTRARRGPVGSLVAASLAHLDRRRFAVATAAYARLHKRIVAAGSRALAIAYPLVAADFATGAETMQDLCEAPLRCGWDRVAIMTYGSLIAGYSRGLLSVADAQHYGYRASRALAAALGRRAGAFVGVVGHGKLGDETAYQHPDELAQEAAAARAAGVGEIALYGLEGVLGSRDPESWLAALTTPRAAPARWRLRGALLHRSIEVGAVGVELWRRLVPCDGAGGEGQ